MHLFWCPQCSPKDRALIECQDKHCLGHHTDGMVYCPVHKGMTVAPFVRHEPIDHRTKGK